MGQESINKDFKTTVYFGMKPLTEEEILEVKDATNKAVQTYKYNVDKYWMRNFLNFIETITTEWLNDYYYNIDSGHKCVLTIHR